MSLKNSLFLLFCSAFLFFPAAAHAHLIGGSGFLSGAAHPLLGLDHLLAMFAVGVMSTHMEKGSVWILPTTFVGFMIFGGILGIKGVGIPFVEPGIAASVLVLGIAIAFAVEIPTIWAVGCVGLFAIFHGHAHGDEFPMIAYPLAYFSGFVLSTTLLHLTGIAIGRVAKTSTISMALLRTTGVSMICAGVAFLFG